MNELNEAGWDNPQYKTELERESIEMEDIFESVSYGCIEQVDMSSVVDALAVKQYKKFNKRTVKKATANVNFMDKLKKAGKQQRKKSKLEIEEH